MAVIGGGNTALQDAIYLNSLAGKIYLIHRRDEFRAEDSVISEFNKICKETDTKITTKLGYVVDQIKGEGVVKSVVLRNLDNQEFEEIAVDGVFVAVGRNPNTDLLDDQIKLDNGYIIVDENMQTNITGVFASGDINRKKLRQIATAIADGAIAGTSASVFVKQIKKEG